MAPLSTLHRQAQNALNAKDYQQAHQHLMAILKQDKNFADAYFLLAMLASDHHNNLQAIELILTADTLTPNNPEYLGQLARLYILENQHPKAVHYANIARTQAIASASVLDSLGVVYSKLGRHIDALPLFEQAIAINDSDPQYHYHYGASLKFCGQFAEARAAHEQAISLAPDHVKAHSALSSLGNINGKNNHIVRLIAQFQRAQQVDDRLHLGHALAREYEALADFDTAFSFLNQVKQDKLKTLNYSIEQEISLFSELTTVFTDPSYTFSQGSESDEPIFIVGMPRTGTTLVERIISAHSDVSTAGELQHFGMLVKQLSQTQTNRVIDQQTVAAAVNINMATLGDAYVASTRAQTGTHRHFIDKMPLNVLYAGFIAKALPNAKIVCLDRNPLDTIVSNFRQLFSVNFSYYNYAYDLATCSQYYDLFRELVSTWQQTLGDNFYVINYEALVNSPETQAKKLIDFCGLEWQDSCLSIDKNAAPVATASALQVRQPISNKSVGNWKKYQQHLSKIIDKYPQNH